MDDLGFIVISYALSLGGTALLSLAFIRRAKKLNSRFKHEDKPWI
mgnify:CR=1 FL=1